MSETDGISMKELQRILSEQAYQNAEQLKIVIQELRKPTILEQKALDAEAREIVAKNEERKSNAGAMLEKEKQKRFSHITCSHKHRDGNTHGVYVMEKAPSPGYIHCQSCHANVRPGDKPEANSDTNGVYDTNLFNRMFQELPTNELFS